MEVLETIKLSDELWEKYFEFHKEVMVKHYPDYTNIYNDWQSFMAKKIFDNKVSENEQYHEYIFYENDKVLGWFNIFVNPLNISFGFDTINENPPDKIYKIVFNYVLNCLNNTNRSYAFSRTYDSRKLKIMEKTKAEKAIDCPLTCLEKESMEIDQYNEWIKSFETKFNYKFYFSTKLQNNLFDKYAGLILPIYEEFFYVNPLLKDVKNKTITKDDLKDIFSFDENPYWSQYYFILFNECEEMIGLNIVIIRKNDPQTIRCNGGLTCVKKEYRGKGIARYLKSKMILYFLENNYDFRRITSDTMLWNKHMYRINEELGFKPYKMGASYKFTKEFLENYFMVSK